MTSNQKEAYAEARRRIEECRRDEGNGIVLNLHDLNLTELPPEVGQLSELREIYLHNNRLSTLPPEIGLLKALMRIDLDHNQLTTLPPEIGQLKTLTKLNLDNNKLTSLPPEIGQLTALETLNLDRNELTELPPEIGNLKKLRYFFLYRNHLSILPPEIGELKRLHVFNPYANQLTVLPPQIGRLKQLEWLGIGDNRLTDLPTEISDLTELKVLSLHNNIGLGLPEEVLGPTWQEVFENKASPKPPNEILDYYFNIQRGRGEPLRELRVIVVGHPKAGKTSLIHRLNGQEMNPQEAETHGIKISAMDFQCVDGPMRARLWDFGGQHVLHAMHEFFLANRCLYLLVLEQRTDRTDKDAKYWLQLIRSYAGDAPVVIALNQSGGVERPWSRTMLERNYGPVVEVVPTECAPQSEKNPNADASIQALRSALTRAMDVMTEPRQKFPRKWSGIKRWLEEMKEPFLDYAEFTRRCSTNEPDPSKQAELAALMNDLGIAMNYARDARLRDTTVLRPDWLANGIYAILRSNMLSPERLVPDGVLKPESLGKIYASAERAGMLNAAEYPAEKFPFLLRLMGLFRLSLPLDTEDREHLVPALLLPDEPPNCAEPEDTGRIRLRYDFDVVPAPLIGRFMVVLFPLVERGKVWQRGACLRYGSARARVWMDVNEDKIWATVGGSHAAQREDLLGMIRETMRRMRAGYRELRMDEHREVGGYFLPHAYLEECGKVPLDPASPLRVTMDEWGVEEEEEEEEEEE